MDELEQIEKDFDNLVNSSGNLNELGTIDLNNILFGYLSETNTFNNGIADYLSNLNRFYKNLPNKQNIDLDTFDKISQKFDEVQEKMKNKKEEVSKILEAKEKDLESINSKISDFKKQIKQIDEEINKMQPNDPNLQSKLDAKIDLENDLDKELNKKLVNEFGEKIKQSPIYRNRVTRINKKIAQKGKKAPSGPTPSSPAPSGPTPSSPTPSGPTPSNPTPSVPVNSIQDYIDRGIIPKIPPKEFSRILSDLSIDHLNTNDLFNKVLTDEQLDRILLNKTVNMYKMKEKISSDNKELTQEYNKLLNSYDKMQEALMQKGATQEASYFDDISDKLHDERRSEALKAKSVNVNDIQSYNLNGKEFKSLDRIDKKVIVNDENLNKQYHLLQNYRRQLGSKNYSSNKKKIEKNIRKTMERIERLQQKQGKLTEKQTMIVNKNNAKYVKHIKARQKAYFRNQAVSSALVQSVNDNIYRVQDSTVRTSLNRISINRLNGDSLSEKARRGILRGNNKVLQARIAAAKKMRGISSSMLEQQLRVSTSQVKGQVAQSM